MKVAATMATPRRSSGRALQSGKVAETEKFRASGPRSWLPREAMGFFFRTTARVGFVAPRTLKPPFTRTWFPSRESRRPPSGRRLASYWR